MEARIVEGVVDGYAATTLISPYGRVTATFLPSLNMLCSSLTYLGEELLHLRAGIAAYAERGKTCGIPFLHPWANRLSSDCYEAAGRDVTLSGIARAISRDGNGLPNHGLLGGPSSWTVESASATSVAAQLVARFAFSTPELLAAFPYPHDIVLRATLDERGLELATTIVPTSSQPVPISFGYHPYFQIPGVSRRQWVVALPVRQHVVVDDKAIPTGVLEDVDIPTMALGERNYDDGFSAIAPPRTFAIEGRDRRIEIEFGENYPYAQIFAPPQSEFVCIEPMTAPTNSLVTGDGLRLARYGEPFEASFRIGISG